MYVYVLYPSPVSSNIFADDLEILVALDKLPKTAQCSIDFIDTMDKLFDLFNSRILNFIMNQIFILSNHKSTIKIFKCSNVNTTKWFPYRL